MFSFRTTPLLEQPDLVLNSGKLAILSNQTAWHPDSGEYLFETLYRRGQLKRVFMPEHGLFGELQDQVKLDRTEVYSNMGFEGVEFISLYGSSEESLEAQKEQLTDIDALIIELQDVGSRYYTFHTTIYNLFKTLKKHEIDLPIYIIDRINPAGRQVEGSLMREEYSSFIGIGGLPHRHGLTTGEISHLFYNELYAKFPLHIISCDAESVNRILLPWSIPPSPNIPGLFTSQFYSGQALWEGTNVSEGRGTTRPFELFGAPFMEPLIRYNSSNGYYNWNDKRHPLFDPSVLLRWTRFIPIFHKYSGELSFGFQLHPLPGKNYHALAHNLKIIKFVASNCEEFKFREGPYEAGNDKRAIELLVGDPLLIAWLEREGEVEWEEVTEHIKVEEQKWIRKAKKVLLYPAPLFRSK